MQRVPLHAGQLAPGAQAPAPNLSGFRLRGGPAPPTGVNEAEIGLALRRNIEQVRRQVDHLRQSQSAQGNASFTTQTSSNSAVSSSVQPNPLQQMSSASSMPTTTTTMRTFGGHPNAPAPGPTPANHNLAGPQAQDQLRIRLETLQLQIALFEQQLTRGIAVPMLSIVSIRTQLLQLLDEQYGDPHSPRAGAIEYLLSRTLQAYTRADQLQVMQAGNSASPHNNISNPPAIINSPGASLHVLTSPDGYQALVAPPTGTEYSQRTQGTVPASRSAHIPVTEGINQPRAPMNADTAVFQNAVRQAYQQADDRDQIGLARHIRRIWLFVRLYFFCYMFSDSGTWERILFVTLAVIVSLLSETSVPRQLYQWTVAPVQRHLESLVHIGVDGNARPQAARDREPGHEGRNGADRAELRVDQQGAVAGVRQGLRRAERSIALFIASLVPGVGERQVEARNAVEAALTAERERAEEERRREEAGQNEGNPEQPSQGEHASASASAEQTDTTENESHTTIPQEEDRTR